MGSTPAPVPTSAHIQASSSPFQVSDPILIKKWAALPRLYPHQPTFELVLPPFQVSDPVLIKNVQRSRACTHISPHSSWLCSLFNIRSVAPVRGSPSPPWLSLIDLPDWFHSTPSPFHTQLLSNHTLDLYQLSFLLRFPLDPSQGRYPAFVRPIPGG